MKDHRRSDISESRFSRSLNRTSGRRAALLGLSVLLVLLFPGAIAPAPAAAESRDPAIGVPASADLEREQGAATDLRGIYVYTGDVSTISAGYADMVTNSLKVPGVDGIVLVIGWSAIEPALGQYQWAKLDQWMNAAVSAGKKIDLTVTAGSDTPSWLFQPAPVGAGATPLDFTISPHSGQTGKCDSETIASPWDPAFLSRWDSLLSALAAHLKAAGTYGAVTLLRLTGINRTTDEFRLPAETPQSTGLACVSDAVTLWQHAGYRPSLLLHGWDVITTSFQTSFPDKSFSVAIIPQNAFPRIAEDGSVIKGTVPDQNQPLLELASHKFPGSLVVQFNFLMPGEPASPAVIQPAQTLGTLAAFQTNEYFGSSGGGAACSEPVTSPTPCTAATYLALLETGIYPLGQQNDLRAQYIEVFPANANAFPADILQAHDELLLTPRDITPPARSPRRTSLVPFSRLSSASPPTSSRSASAAPLEPLASCTSDATTLCLNGGRFRVTASWATAAGTNGSGQAAALTSDTGYFWFFSPSNIEMVVKVLNGCSFNKTFWVFAGGLTNVQVTLTVTDTVTGAVRTYVNPQNAAFQPIQDTSAFAACGTGATAPAPGSGPEETTPVQTRDPSDKPSRPAARMPSGAAATASDATPCVSSATTLCLSGNRFKVEASWEAPSGQSGQGQAVTLTPDTGYFWFFTPSNVELIVKTLSGCGFNRNFWAFAGGLTNVRVTMIVTDLFTGAVRTYVNPQNTSFQPIQDTSFEPCPKAIASISVCAAGSGPSGSCPAGTFDTQQIVLAPDGSGNAINKYGGLGVTSDEHATIFSPGMLQNNSDYLFWVASSTSASQGLGSVVLSGGSGPDKTTGQWTMDFARSDGYGFFPAGYGTILLPAVGGRCPAAPGGNPAQQDPTFDLSYGAPGTVVKDPTAAPGSLLMVYEGGNSCMGIVTSTNPSNNSYLSLGIATSLDYGHTWPTYRGTPAFSFVPLPGLNRSAGPYAGLSAFGASVCLGNDCATPPPATYGRYAVLGPQVSLASIIAAGSQIGDIVGDGEPSAFVDDVSADPAQYLYVVHGYKPGLLDPPLPNGRNSDLMLARARFNGGSAPLAFQKWNGHAFASPGLGGADSAILPDGAYESCAALNQARHQGSINYVDETQQYLLTFVCDSPTDPASGSGAGIIKGSAWFYSTSYDVSNPAGWSTPQEIPGSWSGYDTSGDCFDYKGWYPTLMSLGAKPGHLSTSGYVFYLWGCQGGGAPGGRQYSSRAFTMTIQ